MFTPSPEALRAAEKSLEAAGAIFYHDWPHYQWAAAGGKMLTQAEVDAMCLAKLLAEREPKQLSVPVEVRDKSKGGRPRLAESEKLKCISTLVSPARYAELHAKAIEIGLSVSQLVRPMVDPQSETNKQRLARRHGHSLSVEERKLLREVAGMAGNLNQLAKLAHTAGLSVLAEELRQLLDGLRLLLA
jgi:hypothetical protein